MLLRSIKELAHPDQALTAKLEQLVSAVGEVVLTDRHHLQLAVCCLLARGHLLIEDRPGVGKTTLSHALATAAGLEFVRIQFTSDLLPADVIGASVFDANRGGFHFHPGPIFSNVVLADEINRASPKAQSALLEAMEERQVTVDGRGYPLPHPFVVVATQNPLQQIGTFPLPESQLDRFLMRISLGYPDRQSERKLLMAEDRRDVLSTMVSAITSDDLQNAQRLVDSLPVSEAILDYVQDLLDATRSAPWLRFGLSPRAGLALMQAARAWAVLDGRGVVLPDDVQAVSNAVLGHRLSSTDDTMVDDRGIVDRLLTSVAVP